MNTKVEIASAIPPVISTKGNTSKMFLALMSTPLAQKIRKTTP
jgi:hypothetical protein